MKRPLRILLKILLYTVALIGVLIIGAVLFIFIRYPVVEPASTEKIELKPERIERGAYLVNHVLYCMNCHGERDWTIYSGPIAPGTAGKGAYVDDPVLPAWSGNLTSFALGDWSDGEIVRAITSGIRNDGTALHPLMPFDTYAKMSLQDVQAVVAYLRTLPPVEFTPPEREIDSILDFLLVEIIGRTLPEPYTPPSHPDEYDEAAYGKYLVQIAECAVCHKSNFAGGTSFQNPPGQKVLAKNITPSSTGIGPKSRENFIGVFKAFDNPESQNIALTNGQENTSMPWAQYAGISEKDLGAIYAYLQTIKPVETVLDSSQTQ